jgi:hypothetical protein
MKGLLKLVLVAVLANAGWHAWLVYSSYLKFKDAVESAAAAPGSTDEELRAKVLDLASNYDVPLQDESFTVTHDSQDIGQQRTVVEGSYATKVDVLPRVGVPVTLPFRVVTGIIRIK